MENGDFAVIDFEGFVDDVPFEGGKADNYELRSVPIPSLIRLRIS